MAELLTIKRKTYGDNVFSILNYLLLTIVAFIIIYPMYIILITSISDPYALMRGEITLIPKNIDFTAYTYLFNYESFWKSGLNTIIYTSSGTILNLIVTLMAAYSLTKKFLGKKVIIIYITITMYFSGGLIPTFLLVKEIGLYNSPLVMVIMGAIAVWNLMISRTFLDTTIPVELYEASVMDGCDHFTYFIRVVIPLSKPLVAILVVYYGVGHWNDFMTGLIYLQDSKLFPLQVVIKNMISVNNTILANIQDLGSGTTDMTSLIMISESIKYCVIIVSSLPVIILYMFMQKFFVKGVMIGSLKG